MSVFVCRRALSTATASAASASVRSAGTVSSPVSAASSFAVAAASTKDVRISHPPRISSSRPSALLEAYVRQPPPPPPEPDNAWKRDMFSVMASSPMRECNVTQSHLPSAFMVNFRVGEGEESNVVLPDRLEHPKWKRRRGGRSFWTALHRNAIDRLQGPRGLHFRYMRRIGFDVKMSPDATRLVEEGVIERTIQEATLLAEKLAGDKGQRHLVSLGEGQRRGPRLQPTKDGSIVAVLDLRPPAANAAEVEQTDKGAGAKATRAEKSGRLGRGRYAGDCPAPLELIDLDVLPADGMFKRHDGPAAIPIFRIYDEYGDRADELVRLLRSIRDEDVLVLQVPNEGEPEVIPLCIALWRRMLFTGQGWKTRQ